MGYPMAGHLKKGGHDVTVYNRNPAKAEQWVAEYGGAVRAHARPRRPRARRSCSAASAAMSDLREVTLGRQRRLRRHEERRAVRRSHHGFGRHRPRTGGGSRKARLRFRRCAGFRRRGGRGERQADHHVRRQRSRLCQGRAGHGGLCKAGQAAWARRARASSPRWSTRSASPASCRAWRKAYSLSRAPPGLDIEAVVEVISKGAAQSWQMENRYKTMTCGRI